jgi:hypothetical protein
MPALDNYTKLEKTNTRNPPGQDLNRFKWISIEDMAYICNQMDNCDHFLVWRDGRSAAVDNWGRVVTGGGYLKTNGTSTFADNNIDMYKKKGPVAKVTDAKNDPSVLDSPNTKFQTFSGNNYDGTKWEFGKGNYFKWQDLGNANDQIGSFKVPLGYKAMVFEHCIYPNCWGGKYDRGAGDGGTYVGPTNTDSTFLSQHGQYKDISSMIVEQVPFDIGANFDTMTSKGVDPSDALRIKYNWCKKPENIDSAQCAGFYAMPEAKAAGYNYDIDKFYICKNDPNWFNLASCRTSVNNAVKGSDQSLRQQAKDMVTNYCSTPAGETQADGICGCANVMKYGGQCLTTKAGVPGCRELKATVGDLPPGAQVAFADKFCASDVCVTQALGNAALLPDYTPGKQCPNITQCVQDFRNANFQGSQIDASCKNTVNITGVAPPAPPAAPVAPAPSAPAPSAPAPSAPAPTASGGAAPAAASAQSPIASISSSTGASTNVIWGGIALVVCLLCLCCFMLFGRSSQPQIDPMMLAMLAR